MPARPLKPTGLGARIRTLRMSREWSVRELGKRTGMSRSLLAQLECGSRTDAKLSQTLALADVFGVSLDQLVNREIPAEALIIASEIAAARQRLITALGKG